MEGETRTQTRREVRSERISAIFIVESDSLVLLKQLRWYGTQTADCIQSSVALLW